MTGDPDLLTLKAADRLRRADLVLYDALVSSEIVAMAGSAQRFPVGKRAGRKSIEQGTIERKSDCEGEGTMSFESHSLFSGGQIPDLDLAGFIRMSPVATARCQQ